MQPKTQFENKAQRILCRSHKEPITHLNIKKNMKLGDRLICSKCTTSGTMLSLKKVENILTQAYLDQNIQMKKEFQSIDKEYEIATSNLKICKQNFEVCIMKINNFIINIKDLNKTLISAKYSNLISQAILQFNSQEVINENNLQDIALYLSNQTILKNNDIEFKNQHDKIKSNGVNSVNFNQFNIMIKQINKNLIILEQIFNKNQEEAKNQILEQRYKIKQLNYENSDRIGAVAISNNQLMMASGDRKGKVILWDYHKQTQLREFNGEQYVVDLVFSNDDQLLAVGQFNNPNHILIFNLLNLIDTNPFKRLEGHQKIIRKILFSSDSQMLFSVSWDQTLKVWNINESQVRYSIDLESPLNGLSLSLNEQYIACGGELAYLLYCSNIQNINLITKWKAHQDGAYGVLFTPDSQMVVTSYKEIKVWSVEQLRKPKEEYIPLKVFQGENRMWCLQIRLNDILISNDGKIKIWDMNKEKLIISIDVPSGYQLMSDRKFSFSRDMKYCITGGENCKLNVFTQMEGQQ